MEALWESAGVRGVMTTQGAVQRRMYIPLGGLWQLLFLMIQVKLGESLYNLPSSITRCSTSFNCSRLVSMPSTKSFLGSTLEGHSTTIRTSRRQPCTRPPERVREATVQSCTQRKLVTIRNGRQAFPHRKQQVFSENGENDDRWVSLRMSESNEGKLQLK